MGGHGGHGGGHGGFRGGRGRGGWGWGGYWPWPDYPDPDDLLYVEAETPSVDEIAEAVAEKIKAPAKASAVGESSGFDCLGAETLCGADWGNVLKSTLSKITGSADDKTKAEAKAKEEKLAADAKASKWKWFFGGGAVAAILGVLLLRR